MGIQASCKLLRSTSLSVAEIAEKCGFSEQNYFARHFKQLVGQSPTQFRNKYQA
ncbi:helix-turn-helix domain-containing protein [Lentisphaera marina]|uniref:helix-turn-helix domain-containing protein n=1 Tax=Lentisphaera marina TaxID=1111041 RepID=UPI003B67F13B